MKRNSIIAFLFLTCLSFAAWAHGGMTHVMGTVAEITNTAITVRTTDEKTIEVTLTNATTYEREGKAGARTDIHPGDRVVIHAMPMHGKLEAQDIRFAAAHSASDTR